jgi:hypothetical protein
MNLRDWLRVVPHPGNNMMFGRASCEGPSAVRKVIVEYPVAAL